MRSLSLTIGCLVFVLSLFAQSQDNLPPSGKHHCYPDMGIVHVTLSQKKAANFNPLAVWTNDFSNPADWSMSNTSNPSRDWAIGTAPLPFIGVLNSTSGGNFAGFDSHTDGPSSTQDAVIQTANSIDCSTLPAVQLEFEQVYMHFVDQVFVEVSNDGNNWDQYPVNINVVVNQQTANPDLVNIDISATAANQATVWIAFRFTGAWDYAWAIDDIALQTPPANDLKLSTAFFDGTSAGTPDLIDSSYTLYYTQIPQNHAALDTLTFGASITNQGVATQPNMILTVDVTGALFYNDSSIPFNQTPGSTDYPEITNSVFVPQNNGLYTVDFSASSDSTEFSPQNNSWSCDFTVTDTVYARDNNQFGGGSNFGASKWAGGSKFAINTTDSATSIAFAFHNATTIGATVDFHIYSATNLTTPVYTETNYTLNTFEIGSWIVRPIDPPVELTAGDYVVAFEQLNDTDNLVIMTGSGAPSAPPLTTYVDVDVDNNWAYASFIPFIRLHLQGNTCPAISASFTIAEADCDSSDGSATANPTGGTSPYTYLWDSNASNQTTQTATGLSAGSYSITVTDSLGCSAVLVALVNNVTQPTLTDTVTNASCYGDCDGAIDITPSGNTPFTYNWSNSAVTEDVSGLCAGSYYVTITDSSGCMGLFSFTITQPPALIVTTSQTPDDGNGTGTATANVSGGVSPYSYLWDVNAFSQTTQTAIGLTGGNYSVTVTDSSGCSTVVTVLVTGINALQAAWSFNVFPNPTEGQLTLQFGHAPFTQYKLSIHNLMGQAVYYDQFTLSSTTRQLNLQHLNKGMYILALKSQHGLVTKRIILK